MQDYSAFSDSAHPNRYLKQLRFAAIMALSWATCKRLKNLAQLSLAGVAVVAADFPDNPSGLVFGAYLGLQKAQLDPSRKGMVDEVGECGWPLPGLLYSSLHRAPHRAVLLLCCPVSAQSVR